jgi:hypothetical protein
MGGCAPKAPPSGAAKAGYPPPPDFAVLDTAPVRVPVFFGTNRQIGRLDRPDQYFSAASGDSLRLGYVEVNVPSYRHRGRGEIPNAPALRVNRFWYKPAAETDMSVASVGVESQ